MQDEAGTKVLETFWFQNLTEQSFKKSEVEISCLEDFHELLTSIFKIVKGRKLLWRGLESAKYPLCSTLDRWVFDNRSKELADSYSEVRNPPKPKNSTSGVESTHGSTAGTNSRSKFQEFQSLLWEESHGADNAIYNHFSHWKIDPQFSHRDHYSRQPHHAHMQHFGVPTPLIDFTQNPWIALWFAIAQNRRESVFDARLICLDAHEPNFTRLVRVLYPNAIDPRMRVQQAAFVYLNRFYFPSDQPQIYDFMPVNKLELIDPEAKKFFDEFKNLSERLAIGTLPVPFGTATKNGQKYEIKPCGTQFNLSILIKHEAMEEMRTHLASLGITYAHVFPDISGLADYFTRKRPYREMHQESKPR